MTGIAFIISMAIFVFGMWLMGNATHIAGFEAIVFFAGILCVAIAVAIPMNVLGRSDKA
ncbi:hypothetical protein BJ978_003236 [Agromyces terreus]|uniref:Uncharacterized protein n=1 Tax=Agromyces terreus TaxID=424795 RepID=A0A9X2H4B8_9MICO|nr:hypothetical protein [Agromyces terreus]MCP2372560.1 hypothetical protein [Agromyces terreus]